MTTSRSLNKVMIIGNLTRDPQIKEVGENSKVCTFGVATNSVWRDSQGQAQERTEFHHIVAWNKLGEICTQLLKTSMLVYLEGELRTRTWDDDNGTRHYRVEIKLNDMKLLDSKGKTINDNSDNLPNQNSKKDDNEPQYTPKDAEESNEGSDLF